MKSRLSYCSKRRLLTLHRFDVTPTVLHVTGGDKVAGYGYIIECLRCRSGTYELPRASAGAIYSCLAPSRVSPCASVCQLRRLLTQPQKSFVEGVMQSNTRRIYDQTGCRGKSIWDHTTLCSPDRVAAVFAQLLLNCRGFGQTIISDS